MDGLAFLGQFGGWLAGLVLVSRRKGRGTLGADFGLFVHLRDAWVIAAGVVLEIALTVMILPLVDLAQHQSQDVVKELQDARGLHLWLIALVAGLVAPVCEELLFRGLLLRALRRRVSPVMAVTISALAFALAHPMLDPTIGTLAVVPALFALGAVSAVYRRSGAVTSRCRSCCTSDSTSSPQFPPSVNNFTLRASGLRAVCRQTTRNTAGRPPMHACARCAKGRAHHDPYADRRT